MYIMYGHHMQYNGWYAFQFQHKNTSRKWEVFAYPQPAEPTAESAAEPEPCSTYASASNPR